MKRRKIPRIVINDLAGVAAMVSVPVLYYAIISYGKNTDKPRFYHVEERDVNADSLTDFLIRGQDGKISKVFLGTPEENTYRQASDYFVYRLQAQEDSLEQRLKGKQK